MVTTRYLALFLLFLHRASPPSPPPLLLWYALLTTFPLLPLLVCGFSPASQSSSLHQLCGQPGGEGEGVRAGGGAHNTLKVVRRAYYLPNGGQSQRGTSNKARQEQGTRRQTHKGVKEESEQHCAGFFPPSPLCNRTFPFLPFPSLITRLTRFVHVSFFLCLPVVYSIFCIVLPQEQGAQNLLLPSVPSGSVPCNNNSSNNTTASSHALYTNAIRYTHTQKALHDNTPHPPTPKRSLQYRQKRGFFVFVLLLDLLVYSFPLFLFIYSLP